MSEYQIYAIRYARKDDRRSSENFVGGDAADTPMPLDFFVWALVSRDRTVIVDTGFDEKSGKPRGYAISRPVAEGLKQIDINPDGIEWFAVLHVELAAHASVALEPKRFTTPLHEAAWDPGTRPPVNARIVCSIPDGSRSATLIVIK